MSSNARTLQAWAEADYGFTVGDQEALRVMALWGEGLADPEEDASGLIFEADTADGPVYAELHENADGSFSIIHDKTELERANTNDHQ